MLTNPQVYASKDPWRHWIEVLRGRLDKKQYFIKSHKTKLGVSSHEVEIWERT